MAKGKKSWREKLYTANGLPKVEPIEPSAVPRLGVGTMVIAAPLEVDAIMRRVPEGRLITVDRIRERLAAQHGATIACPLTTGIFVNIAAHAAAESEAAGAPRFTPWWRTLKRGGEVNPKCPGGVEVGIARLRAEGHRVEARGKRFFVVDFESALVGSRRTRARHPLTAITS